jgi:hypothetical protein
MSQLYFNYFVALFATSLIIPIILSIFFIFLDIYNNFKNK